MLGALFQLQIRGARKGPPGVLSEKQTKLNSETSTLVTGGPAIGPIRTPVTQ